MPDDGDDADALRMGRGRGGDRAPDQRVLRPGGGGRPDLAVLPRRRQRGAPGPRGRLVVGGVRRARPVHARARRLREHARQAPRPGDRAGAARPVRLADEPGRRRRRPPRGPGVPLGAPGVPGVGDAPRDAQLAAGRGRRRRTRPSRGGAGARRRRSRARCPRRLRFRRERVQRLQLQSKELHQPALRGSLLQHPSAFR